MKKIIFGLIAMVVLAFNAHSQNIGAKVGEIKDGKFVLVENLSFLKEKWDKILIENKLEGEIVRFEISSDKYMEDEKTTVT
jgi:hypothetical protein